jgi:Family of unknown function (DUF5762)
MYILYIWHIVYSDFNNIMSTSQPGYEKMNIQTVGTIVEEIVDPSVVVQEIPSCNLDESNTPCKKRKSSKTIPFWGLNPNVLLDSTTIFEFFPIESMTYEQKLNAITRSVLVLTIVSFAYSQSYRLLAISTISLLAICLLFYAHHRTCSKEGFGDDNEKAVQQFLEEKALFNNQSNTFVSPTSQNPLSNVLIPEYEYDPNRHPAPPSYNTKVESEILEKAKQMVQESNPGQPDIAKKLFTDLADEFEFEQSMRPFFSTANTMIPNDQGAFAQFCYGNMVSCKEGNMFACARNDMSRYNNY